MDLSKPASDLVEVVSLFIRGVSANRSLSLTAIAVLGSLDRSGSQRITTLAVAQGVSQPSMTQLIQRLEQRGLVSRASDPADGRVALVSLTSQGRSVLAERRRQNAERVAQWLAGLPEDDANALARGLAAALPVIRQHITAQARETGQVKDAAQAKEPVPR
jgi:DNA-binding MarR family transcriptional regulator